MTTSSQAPHGASAEPAPSKTPRTVTLHVCTSCRSAGAPREPYEARLGYKLYEALRKRVKESDIAPYVDLKAAECLSLCPRPCGIAMSCKEGWTYLFGDQEPGESPDAILECVSLYLKTRDGYMPRGERPKPLRASVLGRVPPLVAKS